MKIVADENMPFVDELFGELGDVVKLNGRSITAEHINDADVLLVRSVTTVNEALLGDSNTLRFVGSATIGTDHIDQGYLAHRGIRFANAPGCNAIAVGEYAFNAMLELAQRERVNLKDKVVGIVGAGNTGSALAKCLASYGVKVLLNDPILAAKGDGREFVTLDELIAAADVVSLHVPLTREGQYKTHYLFDESRLTQLKHNCWLLNCCRGDVVDNRGLIAVKQHRPMMKLVLDVWEGEPIPMPQLVDLADIATPHIAGYSLEGKARGTYMLYQHLCQELNVDAAKTLNDLLPKYHWQSLKLTSEPTQFQLLRLIRSVYDLRDDDRIFRDNYAKPSGFDQMRKNHRHRREFNALKLESGGLFGVNWLLNVGFSGVGS